MQQGQGIGFIVVYWLMTHDAGFDHIEASVLEVARLYWQNFAVPETQSWLHALERSELTFGDTHGGKIALEILAAVQAMRLCRSSCFLFNDPMCEGCSVIVSEHERQFMNVFRAARDKRWGSARTHAMILCEGNKTDQFLDRISHLTRALYGDSPETRMDQNSASFH